MALGRRRRPVTVFIGVVVLSGTRQGDCQSPPRMATVSYVPQIPMLTATTIRNSIKRFQGSNRV